MQKFLQSPVRKTIKADIYQEPVFDITLFDKPYFGFRKDKHIGPFTLSRSQILGINIPLEDPDRIRAEIKKTKQDLWTGFGTIFVQRGITNELSRFPNISRRSSEFRGKKHDQRQELEDNLYSMTKLKPSIRENMALSSILIDAQQTDEEFLKAMSRGSDRNVKRAIKEHLEFHVLQAHQDDEFYESRRAVSQEKWFSIIPQERFRRLANYLRTHNYGNIFIVTKGNLILWGAIVVIYEDTMTYLYGFANRHNDLRNLGWNHYMRYQLFVQARTLWLSSIDLFGGAPSGYPDHPLAGVSRFKEWLGGDKIEYFWNYDIVTNSLLYPGAKLLYT